MFDTNEINPFEGTDEGNESTPTVSETASEPVITEPADSKEDSVTETTLPESTDAKSVAEEGKADETVSESAPADKSEKKTIEELVADVDKEINNEKNSAYYRHGLKTYKNAFLEQTESVVKQYEPLKAFGDVDKVANDLEMLKGLDATIPNPTTQLPEKSVKPFVEAIVKSRGMETAYSLIQEFGKLPSAKINGGSLFHEWLESNGLDPRRINEFREFTQNGGLSGLNYPAPDEADLEIIPEHLRATFAAKSPDRRDQILLMDDDLRDEYLEAEKFKADQQAERDLAAADKAQREEAAKVEAEKKFYADWDREALAEAEKSGSRITEEFTNILVNDAKFEPFEALSTTLLVTAAINGAGAEGAQARALLEKEGLTLDAKLSAAFENWQKETRNLAYYTLAENEAEKEKTEATVAELEKQMLSKANPIVAHFAAKRGQAAKVRIETANRIIDDTQQFKTGINSTDGAASTIGTGTVERTPAQREAILANPFG